MWSRPVKSTGGATPWPGQRTRVCNYVRFIALVISRYLVFVCVCARCFAHIFPYQCESGGASIRECTN